MKSFERLYELNDWLILRELSFLLGYSRAETIAIGGPRQRYKLLQKLKQLA